MLKHFADKHITKIYVLIRDIKEQDNIKQHQEHIVVLDRIKSDKFKCDKCKEIIWKADALKAYIEGGHNICSLCAILSYGDN